MGIRGHRQNARLAQQPSPAVIGELHAPEVAAVHIGNAIVTRQLFVQERVVGRQQIDDAAILSQLTVEEQLDFLHERGSQVVVKPWKLLVRVRREQPDIANLQPLAEEIPDERRPRARIGQHAADLLLENL